MAGYVVKFKHFSREGIEALVPVSFDIDPKNAADEYETIIIIAYSLLVAQVDGLAALGVQGVDDMVAMNIKHNDEMIIDFS